MKLPWWALIAVKLVLSRLPLGYRLFAWLGVFKHGRMHDPTYAIGIFNRHFARRGSANRTPFVGLEFGVGDSVASAVIASAHGASHCYLVDAGRFSVEDVTTYKNVATHLHEQGLDVPDLTSANSLEDVLTFCSSDYLTDGLQSLRLIDDQSIDFAWSNAVLEHVRLDEFVPVLAEFRRIMKPGSLMSHRVDLKDHLGGALNNHRLPRTLWEQDWFANSGFYTNRITLVEMLELFAQADFDAELVQIDKWQQLPTARKDMAREIDSLAERDLLVSGFDVLLRPGAAGTGNASMDHR